MNLFLKRDQVCECACVLHTQRTVQWFSRGSPLPRLLWGQWNISSRRTGDQNGASNPRICIALARSVAPQTTQRTAESPASSTSPGSLDLRVASGMRRKTFIKPKNCSKPFCKTFSRVKFRKNSGFCGRQLSTFCRAGYQMRPESTRRHAYLDRNSRRLCARRRPDLFSPPPPQSACQCCLSIWSNLPAICSAANKHFMCHRGTRHAVSLGPPFVLFCCRRCECTRKEETLGVSEGWPCKQLWERVGARTWICRRPLCH